MMTPTEICREYRLAKDKKEQIKILADENCTTQEEIIKVLLDCGEMEAPEETTKPKTNKPKQAKQPYVPDAVKEILCRRMDELDKAIKPLEDQLEPLKIEYKEIASFLKGCGKETVE